MSDTVILDSPAPAPVSPDVFTADEAWKFLKLPSKSSFDHNRRRIEKEMNLNFGRRFGQEFLYPREHLEQMRRILFGLDQADDQDERSPRKKGK